MHFIPVRIASPLVSGVKILGNKLGLEPTLAANAVFALGLAELSKLKRRERQGRARNAAGKSAELQEARPSTFMPESAPKQAMPRLPAPTKPTAELSTPVRLLDPVVAVVPKAPKPLCTPQPAHPDYRRASRPPGPTIRDAMPRTIIKTSAPRACNERWDTPCLKAQEKRSTPSTLRSGFLCGCNNVFYVDSQSEIDAIIAAKKQGQKPRCPTCVKGPEVNETAA